MENSSKTSNGQEEFLQIFVDVRVKLAFQKIKKKNTREVVICLA